MKHEARLVNNRLLWIRLPDDSGWFRLAPDLGPWWSHNRDEAVAKAAELDWAMTARHYPSIIRTPPTAEDFAELLDQDKFRWMRELMAMPSHEQRRFLEGSFDAEHDIKESHRYLPLHQIDQNPIHPRGRAPFAF
jgi:hypothetical protein